MKKIDHIIFLRAAAILLVVFAHATRISHSPNPHMYSPFVTPWWEVTVKNYIYSFHMPLFFWISGFVFYFTTIEGIKQVAVVSQIVTKIKRLIIPLYSTSFFILLPAIIFFGKPNQSITNQIKLFILGSNNDHLWFLKSLFIIFLTIIPICKIIKQDRIILYLTTIACCVTIASINPPFLSQFQSPLKYFPFFLAGCLFKKYLPIVSDKNNFALLSLFFSLHIILLITKKIFGLNLPLNALWYIISLSGICFMYFGSLWLTPKILKSQNIWNKIKLLDQSSYTIYLFHVSFLYIILFASRKAGVEMPPLRIFISTLSGIVLPIYIHENLLTRSKILSFAFASSYEGTT